VKRVGGDVLRESLSAVVKNNNYFPRLTNLGESANIFDSYPSSLIGSHRGLSSFYAIACGLGRNFSGLGSDFGGFGRTFHLAKLAVVNSGNDNAGYQQQAVDDDQAYFSGHGVQILPPKDWN
jgi:hypothetical protein